MPILPPMMGPGPTIISPPPSARLPVMALRQIRACSTRMELRPNMSVADPQWKLAGLLVAYMRADSRMSPAGTQVISATRSGVYSAARARSSSKPTVHSSTKALSYSPSSMMTLIHAIRRAVSVPGRSWSHMSAWCAGFGLARIDDDDLDLFGLHPLAQALPVERRRMPDVVAVKHHAVHLVDFGPRVGAAQQRVVHGDGVAAADGAGAADVRGIAEEVEEPGAHGVHVAAVGALVEGEGLGPVLCLQAGELFRYLVERLIPGDLLPPVLAALPDPLERMHELLRAVEPLDVVGHAVAAAAVGGGIVGIASKPDQLAVLHRRDQPALVDAARRGPADDLLLLDHFGHRRARTRIALLRRVSPRRTIGYT